LNAGEEGISPEEMENREAREREAENKFRGALVELLRKQVFEDHPALDARTKEAVAAANDVKFGFRKLSDGKFAISNMRLIHRSPLGPGTGVYEDSRGRYITVLSSGLHDPIEQIETAEKASGSQEGSDEFLRRSFDEAIACYSTQLWELQEEMSDDELKSKGLDHEVEALKERIEGVEALRREMFSGV